MWFYRSVSFFTAVSAIYIFGLMEFVKFWKCERQMGASECFRKCEYTVFVCLFDACVVTAKLAELSNCFLPGHRPDSSQITDDLISLIYVVQYSNGTSASQ